MTTLLGKLLDLIRHRLPDRGRLIVNGQIRVTVVNSQTGDGVTTLYTIDHVELAAEPRAWWLPVGGKPEDN